MRYDVISTYFYVYLTRIIKRCRHGIMIIKNKKKKKQKIFIKIKKGVKKLGCHIFLYIRIFIEKK